MALRFLLDRVGLEPESYLPYRQDYRAMIPLSSHPSHTAYYYHDDF